MGKLRVCECKQRFVYWPGCSFACCGCPCIVPGLILAMQGQAKNLLPADGIREHGHKIEDALHDGHALGVALSLRWRAWACMGHALFSGRGVAAEV